MTNRVLVTGATGQLGAYLMAALSARGVDLFGWGGTKTIQRADDHLHGIDLADGDFTRTLRQLSPQAIIHAAAMPGVADCARDPKRAMAVNVDATRLLAETATEIGCRLVFISTDLVFDGETGNYSEADVPKPLSIYGQTKVDAERAVLAFPGHCAVRVSLLFGPPKNGRSSFFSQMIDSLRGGVLTKLFHDEWRSLVGLRTAAEAIVEIAFSDVTGLLHVAGPERMSRVEMGQRLAAYLGFNDECIEKISRLTAAGEPRPRDTSLNCTRWRTLFPRHPRPNFEESLAAMGLT